MLVNKYAVLKTLMPRNEDKNPGSRLKQSVIVDFAAQINFVISYEAIIG